LVSESADVSVRREAVGTAARNARDVIGKAVEKIKDDGDLVQSMKKDVSAHDLGEEGLCAPVRLTL